MNDQDFQQFATTLETDYLRILIGLLRSGRYRVKDVQEKSTEFLGFLPFTTIEDMEAKIKTFSEKYPECAKLYITVLNYKAQNQSNALLAQMREKMKENKMDEALQVVK